jgi:hypothetical protein
MALRMICARRQELEDEEQILALRTELRSNRLNRSGVNKIVRSRSAIRYSIKWSGLHENSASMTEHLIATRAAIILWTGLAVIPAKMVFDAIEAELERRGVTLGFIFQPREQS